MLAPDQFIGLSREWRADPVAFVRESYREDPEGRAVSVDPPQAQILEGWFASGRFCWDFELESEEGVALGG